MNDCSMLYQVDGIIYGRKPLRVYRPWAILVIELQIYGLGKFHSTRYEMIIFKISSKLL